MIQFKVGDKVFDVERPHIIGEVISLTSVYKGDLYPVEVEFGRRSECYTLDGRLVVSGNVRLLHAENKEATTEIHTLTKREQFAMAAMKSLLSRENSHKTFSVIAMESVIIADMLTKELNKQKYE
jgi:hypothetical protein